MLSRINLLSAAALSLTASSFVATGAHAATSTLIPARAIVYDASTYKIASDGGGDYINGQQGVSCGFHPANGDFTLNTYDPSSNTKTRQPRMMSLHFDTPLALCD